MTTDAIASLVFTTAALQSMTDQEKQAIYASPMWPIVIEIRNLTLRLEDNAPRVFIHRTDYTVSYRLKQILLTNAAGITVCAVAYGSGVFQIRNSTAVDSHPDHVWQGAEVIGSKRVDYIRQQIKKLGSAVRNTIKHSVDIADGYYRDVVSRTVIGYVGSKNGRESIGQPVFRSTYDHVESTYLTQVAMGERTFDSLPETFKTGYMQRYEAYAKARDKWLSAVDKAKTMFSHDKWMIGISQDVTGKPTQIVIGKVRTGKVTAWLDDVLNQFNVSHIIEVDTEDFKVYASVDHIEEPLRKALDMRLTMLNIYRGLETDPWRAEIYLPKFTNYADNIPPVYWDDARVTGYWMGPQRTMWLMVDTYE
jgi:hypothetical protein